MTTLLERAVAVVRAHPDAERVSLSVRYGDPAETSIIADGKQIERALCNLLLKRVPGNASGGDGTDRYVDTRSPGDGDDCQRDRQHGEGVPEVIRDSLF